MAVRLSSCRSKSTSDILDEIAYEEEMSQASSFHVGSKHRPCTVDDLGEEKKFCTKNLNCERKKEHSTQKPQNFVKKLIASLEKKNEACKADDEFLTKYYRRNDYSNPNSDYSNDAKLRFSENIKRFNREKYIPNSNLKTNTTHLENYKQNGNIEINNVVDLFPNTQTSIPSNEKSIRQSTSMEALRRCSSQQGSNIGTVDPQNKKYCRTSYVQYDLQKDVDVHANEKKGHIDSSSFDPNRSRVELENRTDTGNSCFFESNKGDPKRSSFERIFISFGGEDTLKMSSMKKKVNRKKSVKDFFGSIIRWKKSEKKEKPWRYMSCDHLLGQSDGFATKDDKKLSRAISFQAMVFQDCDERNMSQIKERKATIRPIYGGKRYEHRLELCVKKIEDRNFPIVEANLDDLIKPPIIQDMEKYFSQYSQKATINNNRIHRKKTLAIKQK